MFKFLHLHNSFIRLLRNIFFKTLQSLFQIVVRQFFPNTLMRIIIKYCLQCFLRFPCLLSIYSFLAIHRFLQIAKQKTILRIRCQLQMKFTVILPNCPDIIDLLCTVNALNLLQKFWQMILNNLLIPFFECFQFQKNAHSAYFSLVLFLLSDHQIAISRHTLQHTFHTVL